MGQFIIYNALCLVPCDQELWSADELHPEIDTQNCQWLGQLPKCSACGYFARPNILMFDDYDWLSHRHHLHGQRLDHFIKVHRNPIVIEIGAGTAIPTVRYFSERFAPNLIRINPREYTLPPHGGIALASNAEAGIKSIYQIFIK